MEIIIIIIAVLFIMFAFLPPEIPSGTDAKIQEILNERNDNS